MLIAALAYPAAAQSVAKIPTRHVEGGDAVAALALPRRPIAPLVNDATIVDQDAIPSRHRPRRTVPRRGQPWARRGRRPRSIR